jgi:hypothetical protein
VTCVVCDEALNPEEEGVSAWYPEPWCAKCMKEEDTRSQDDDTILDTGVTWRMPRYYTTRAEWSMEASQDRFDELVKTMLIGKGIVDDEGEDE